MYTFMWCLAAEETPLWIQSHGGGGGGDTPHWPQAH